jgi:hypothetical protein
VRFDPEMLLDRLGQDRRQWRYDRGQTRRRRRVLSTIGSTQQCPKQRPDLVRRPVTIGSNPPSADDRTAAFTDPQNGRGVSDVGD